MAISIRNSIKNIFNDKDFTAKYSILVVLSFICGLFVFATLAHNKPLIIPTAILATLAGCTTVGYDITYLKALMEKEDAKLPEWDKFFEYFNAGLKFLFALLLLAASIMGAVLLLTFLGKILLGNIKIIMIIFFTLLNLLALGFEIYLLFCGIGFLYVFIESDYSIISVFNLKKIYNYFSTNYFIALFAMVTIAGINGVLATLTTIRIKYALFYIIPLLIAPFLRLITNNLIAQAHIADKNNESGSVWKLILYIATASTLITSILLLGTIGKYLIH